MRGERSLICDFLLHPLPSRPFSRPTHRNQRSDTLDSVRATSKALLKSSCKSNCFFYLHTPVTQVAWHSLNTANCCCYVYVIPPSKSARFALDLDIPSFSNAGPEKWARDDKLTSPPSWMLLSGHERNSTHILAMHYQHQFRRHVHFGNHVMWIVGFQTKFFRFTNQICRRVLPG